VNDPIRVGVLGAGAIAQVAHLPVLRRLPGVEVAAICDNDVSKAQALAARFEVKDTYDGHRRGAALRQRRRRGDLHT